MHQDEVSLLQSLKSVRENENIPEGGLSTVIFCGKVQSDADVAAALQTHRTIVENQKVFVTGLLIAQGTSILHLLEGPSFSVLSILNELASHPDFGNSVQTGTVVYSLEDSPKHNFPEWYSCEIKERKSSADDLNEESCKDVVSDIANKLLKIGEELKGRQNDSQDIELSSYAEQIPGAKLVMALAASSLFFSLQDFVQFYFDPYHVDIASEQSWPLQRLVTY